VFAPLFAILFVDFYIFGKRNISAAIDVPNLILWAAGFVLYRALMSYSFVLGVTFPVILVIGAASFCVNKKRVRKHLQETLT
jgi:purine-cytosine permease-like protein